MVEQVVFPNEAYAVIFVLIWTLGVSLTVLLYKIRKERNDSKSLINKLTEQARKVRAGDWGLIQTLQKKLAQKHTIEKPKQYEGRWQDPDHPILSGEGGKGWEDPDHPIMR